MARRVCIRLKKNDKCIWEYESVAMHLIDLGEAVLVNSRETTAVSPSETAMKKRARFNKRG